ncbi:MAG: hypothetical protein GY867_10895 [bacterium]|nr:hypothetical protein [bacterium]
MSLEEMAGHDRVDFLEKNLARQLSWIGAADSKISFVFAANTAMLGLLAAVAPAAANDWGVVQAVSAALAAFLQLICLFYLFKATFPITVGPRSSLIFFGGVARHGIDEFRSTACNMTLEEYIDDLCSQCHRNAEIADRKYSCVKCAMILLYTTSIPWAVAILLLYKDGV